MDVYQDITSIALNWYRDENGIDQFEENGFSVGEIISSSAVVFFASIYREYVYFKNNYTNNDLILYNENEHPIKILIARNLSQNFKIDNTLPISNDVLDRVHITVPAYKKFGKYIAFLQYPILPFLKKKKLYLSDWTYSPLEKIEKEKSLFVNSKNIFKGAYLCNSRKYIKNSNNFLPLILDKNKVKQSLNYCNQKLLSKFPDELINIFCEYLILFYNNNRIFFVNVIAYYEELIDRYKPSSVVFPGELYEPYNLIKFICDRRGIKKIFMLDGFPLFVYYPVLKDRKNKSYTFDKYIAFGLGMKNDFLTKNIADEQIKMLKWPVFEYYDHQEDKFEKFECIIMTWIPFNNNPTAKLNSQNEILAEVISFVKSKGYSNIAIKIKGSVEKNYVLSLLENESNIVILEGPLYKHLKKAKMIIGGISSAIAEARYCDIPYYIYEPNHNGYPDSLIFNSSIISRDVVARNIDELDNNIKTNTSILNIDKTFLIHNTSKKNA